jgi:hypothetical protein
MAATVEERLARLEEQVATLKERANTSSRGGFGLTLEEARERLKKPVQRSPETIAKFRRLFGSFEGPEDLSVRMRDYLYGDVPAETQ